MALWWGARTSQAICSHTVKTQWPDTWLGLLSHKEESEISPRIKLNEKCQDRAKQKVLWDVLPGSPDPSHTRHRLSDPGWPEFSNRDLWVISYIASIYIRKYLHFIDQRVMYLIWHSLESQPSKVHRLLVRFSINNPKPETLSYSQSIDKDSPLTKIIYFQEVKLPSYFHRIRLGHQPFSLFRKEMRDRSAALTPSSPGGNQARFSSGLHHFVAVWSDLSSLKCSCEYQPLTSGLSLMSPVTAAARIRSRFLTHVLESPVTSP